MLDTDKLRNALDPVFRARRVTAAVMFGSAVSGKLRPDSDIDIAVEIPAPMDFGLHAEISSELRAAAASSGIVREIDLAYLNRADPLFLKKIFERAAPLYGDARHLAEWRLRAFRAYQDFRPYLRIEADTARRIADRLSA